MELRVFCVLDHGAIQCQWIPESQLFMCPICKFSATDESVYRALPESYKNMCKGPFGSLVASLLDVGGIDLTYRINKFTPEITYIRESQL